MSNAFYPVLKHYKNEGQATSQWRTMAKDILDAARVEKTWMKYQFEKRETGEI